MFMYLHLRVVFLWSKFWIFYIVQHWLFYNYITSPFVFELENPYFRSFAYYMSVHNFCEKSPNGFQVIAFSVKEVKNYIKCYISHVDYSILTLLNGTGKWIILTLFTIILQNRFPFWILIPLVSVVFLCNSCDDTSSEVSVLAMFKSFK